MEQNEPVRTELLLFTAASALKALRDGETTVEAAVSEAEGLLKHARERGDGEAAVLLVLALEAVDAARDDGRVEALGDALARLGLAMHRARRSSQA